jgi:hypothetical protein
MKKKTNDILMGLSVLAAVLAGYVSVFQTDFMALAGTQWMLIAIVLAIYGIYAKMRIAN